MPNVVNVGLTLLFGALLQASPYGEQQKKKYFLFLVWCCLWFVAGTRGTYALSDTEAYQWTYFWAGKNSLPELVSASGVDILYYLTCWIFAHMGIPWQVFLCLHAAFVIGVFCCWVYRFSKDPLTSMLIFECLFLNVWQGAMRQAMAMACCLIAHILLTDGKKRRALMTYLLALGFHATAIICLPFAIVRKCPASRGTVALYIAVCGGCFALRSQLLQFINWGASLLGRNMYTSFWREEPKTLILLCILIVLAAVLVRRPILSQNPEWQEYYPAVFLMLSLLSLGGGTMVRLAWYYGVFLCLLIPAIYEGFKQKQTVSVLTVLLLLALYLRRADMQTWYFFWQE